MSWKPRVLPVLIVVAVLALVAVATRIVLDWETVSENLVEALDTQTEKAEATLFRLGETLSIGAELKKRFGFEPEVSYRTDTGVRTLRISFNDYSVPAMVIPVDHARQIAIAAIEATTKADQVDAVDVRFRTSPANRPVGASDSADTFLFRRTALTAPGGGPAEL